MISPILILVASLLCIQYAHSFSSPAAAVSPIYETIQSSTFLDTNGDEIKLSSSADSNNNKKLVVILPQLGEFDSSEVNWYILCVFMYSSFILYQSNQNFVILIAIYIS